MPEFSMPNFSSAPSLSIVICSRNRARSLAATLQSLVALRCEGIPAIELIVVDNGSTDGTGDMLRKFAAGAPFPVIVIAELRPGLSRARNRGVAAAQHDVVLFTDDDCLVSTDWAVTAARLFGVERDLIIGGRVELHDASELPLAIKTDPARQELRADHALLGFLHGANMGFGRHVPARIGGFDERFGTGGIFRSAEDTEFVYRALRAGVPVAYEPDLVVSHHHGRTGMTEWYRQMRQHAVGNGAMMMKHALSGRPASFKIAYWDVCSELRRWRRGEREWQRLVAKSAMAGGVLGYLVRYVTHPGERRALSRGIG